MIKMRLGEASIAFEKVVDFALGSDEFKNKISAEELHKIYLAIVTFEEMISKKLEEENKECVKN